MIEQGKKKEEALDKFNASLKWVRKIFCNSKHLNKLATTTMIKPIPASAYAGKDNRLSDVVYESLLEDILSGRRQAGEPLSELALTKVLKVSRTPVHNAMLQLIKDGLVKQDPNCRPVVMGVESKDIIEIYEMRILLEGETAYQAATRMRS